MTDDQKRIAIAEEDGWKWMRWGDHSDAMLFLVRPDFPRGSFVPSTRKLDENFRSDDLPPYLTSRDAIVPAILRRFRTDHEKHKFNMALRDALDNWGGIEVSVAFALATADPRVLADAYLAAAARKDS